MSRTIAFMGTDKHYSYIPRCITASSKFVQTATVKMLKKVVT